MKSQRLIGLALIPLAVSCTDLDEDLYSNLSDEQGRQYFQEHFDALVEAVYRDFDNIIIQHTGCTWLLQEISADGAIVPSRPSGWDNGGVFRQLHTHSWTPEHPYVISVWNGLNKGVFDATNVLSFNPERAVEAEARFLRAFFLYQILDLFGQVPFRDPGESLMEAPLVMSGSEAIDFIIREVEEVLPDLPESGPAYRASKNAARGLLARMYLNRGVYENRENPQFSQEDMDQVIRYADAITGKSLDFYWNSFGPDNNEVSSELIFTVEGEGGVRSHSLWVWQAAIFPAEMGLPYGGGGWNGFAAIGDFYGTFEEGDIRRYYEHPHTMEKAGYNVGFLTGQQYDVDGKPIPNVVFRKEVPTLIGASLWDGYRPVKYVPDYDHPAAADNDIVLIRYADVLLMKAEALLRKGENGEAFEIVNMIREERGVEPFTDIDLDRLLEERGRELYWEGHRRQDLIRFGKFLEPWHLKPATDPKYLLFAIPEADVLGNPNLEQNPGF